MCRASSRSSTRSSTRSSALGEDDGEDDRLANRSRRRRSSVVMRSEATGDDSRVRRAATTRREAAPTRRRHTAHMPPPLASLTLPFHSNGPSRIPRAGAAARRWLVRIDECAERSTVSRRLLRKRDPYVQEPPCRCPLSQLVDAVENEPTARGAPASGIRKGQLEWKGMETLKSRDSVPRKDMSPLDHEK